MLQSQGVEIALSEVIDASSAAAAIDLGSRRQLREALRATLIKHQRHNDRFDAAFERLFPARAAGEPPAGDPGQPLDDLAGLISTGGDLEAAASALVDAYGGLGGELRSERHHYQRVLRGADLARLLSDARRRDPSQPVDDLRARIEQLKRLITADLRAHLADTEETGLAGDLADVEFLNATRAQLDGMREAIRPLARKLAGRLARRRVQRAGRVHMRRTTRRSLSTGGVPLDVVHHRPRVQRPELFVLCDISGSVAEFAVFTLTLMASLSAEVANARSFVFVDAIDEITDLLARTEHGIEPWQILRNTNVIGDDGHSDYGAVLEQFWEEVGRSDLRGSSTVIITGDARCNYRPPRADLLARMARRTRRIYWLNPEPRSDWDTHDSEIGAYARHVSELFEVRNLRQLMACVEQVL
jgi:uncharacterized protein with von Willebrand factor type A (vWA) domain